MKRLRVLLAALACNAAMAVLVAEVAQANQSNHGFRITLFNCSPGPTTYQVIQSNGFGVGGFNVGGSTMEYKMEALSWTDASGFHEVDFGKATANRQLVTCQYIGPESGTLYTTVGFFTPVG